MPIRSPILDRQVFLVLNFLRIASSTEYSSICRFDADRFSRALQRIQKTQKVHSGAPVTDGPGRGLFSHFALAVQLIVALVPT